MAEGKSTFELKRCSRCVMPETWESINYDAEGICNICRNSEIKKTIDWSSKKEEFKALVAEYKGKGLYDCIVPFSGGKDSTYTAYSLMKDYGLKPLVVSFDHGFYRPNMLDNRVRAQKVLGFDFLNFRTDWQIVKKLMLESLKRKGDFHWHGHTGSFAFPMQVAVRFKVPLVIWGEPSSEYTGHY
ncbi:MAG: N-acetyl sugar amidotransferase, partial [Candidatus Komeilibacteria bacterium]|nr:N-acetyl sugar amidotransferase [Candidatus Komeilibacteria bacterium]